jgi:hypothetical protein
MTLHPQGPGGLDRAPAFLNLCNDAIDTGRHCLLIGAWEQRAKFIDEIFPHPLERCRDLLVEVREQAWFRDGRAASFAPYDSPCWACSGESRDGPDDGSDDD